MNPPSNDRERIWHEMMAHARYLIMPKAASLIDIALWDLAGKQAGPISRRNCGAP